MLPEGSLILLKSYSHGPSNFGIRGRLLQFYGCNVKHVGTSELDPPSSYGNPNPVYFFANCTRNCTNCTRISMGSQGIPMRMRAWVQLECALIKGPHHGYNYCGVTGVRMWGCPSIYCIIAIYT
eukprot:4980659-Pyramimonas_sp.AAC.2